MNRRHFLSAVAMAAGTPAVRRAFGAARYDLIIKDGRVIDPLRKLDAVRDVGIANGRIAAIEASLSGAAETLDVRGKLVTPGLIDIHTHATRSPDGPKLCLADGVTGLIDAGTQGADGIELSVRAAQAAPQTCRVLINIGRKGILSDAGDTMDLSLADVGAAKQAVARYRDTVVGVKARLSRDVAGTNDFEVLRRAQEVASSFHLPVMIHMGQTMSPLSKLMPLLKSGDIVTHMFAPPPNSIIDDSGRILPEVTAARRRGVIFDLGNGRTGHLRWDIAEAVLKAGFLPDTFSTDWTPEGRTSQIIDFPNVMSKFLMLGLPLDRVIASATESPSRAFPVFRDKGAIKVGAPADLAVLELREGNFEFVDNFGNMRTGKQRLFPVATVLAGKIVSKRS